MEICCTCFDYRITYINKSTRTKLQAEPHQSGGVNENAAGEKRNVVASIEAVPERTEEEHWHRALYTVIDDETQPVSCRTIPVVKQLFEAGA